MVERNDIWMRSTKCAIFIYSSRLFLDQVIHQSITLAQKSQTWTFEATWWMTKRLLLCWTRNCSKDLQFKFKNTVLNSVVVTGYAYKKIRSLTHIIYKKNFFRQDQDLNIKYQISKTFRKKCRDLNDLGVWNRFLK